MKWNKWLEKWDMSSLKIKTPFLDMEWKPNDEDKNAAWELYIELLTRVTTQKINDNHGCEESALNSIYSLFPLTREIIKKNGRHCIEFTKIAVLILNQVVRPFTAKWHKLYLNGAFSDKQQCLIFRKELDELQVILITYTKMLSDMAGVEDLSDLSDLSDS